MSNRNSSKKSIILVGPSPELLGGVSTSVSHFLSPKLKEIYDIIFFESGRGTGGGSNFSASVLRAFIQLIDFFKLIRVNESIIHIHTSSWGGFWRFGLYVFTCKLLNRKVILHIHGAEFKEFFNCHNFFLRNLIVELLQCNSALIVLSEGWKIFFDSIAPKVKKFVVENSVYLPDNLPVRNYSQNTRVLFLGGFMKRKGINELLKVIPEILQVNPQISFTVAGFPSNAEIKIFDKLKNYADQSFLKLKINVSEREKKHLYLNSDIFLLQSFDEGLPFTVLEAMSYGLTIVTTPVGAIPEVVVDKENGFIIEPGNHEELNEIILKLADQRDYLDKIYKNNVQKIQDDYSHESMIRKMNVIYSNF